jgi:hypothetical protein
MALKYDGDFTVAAPTGGKRFAWPIENVNVPYVFTQEFMQLEANFAPLALNTPHGTLTDYLLVAESERVAIGGGLVRWLRTYAKVPASFAKYEQFAMSYPGLMTYTVSGVNQLGRAAFTRSVLSMLAYDFFIVDTSLSADAPPKYKAVSNIPVIPQMAFCLADSTGSDAWGGVNYPVQLLTSDATLTSTLPYYGSSDSGNSWDYRRMMKDARTNGWAATKTVLSIDASTGVVSRGSSIWGGLLPAEESKLTQWMGNIYVRVTRYVKAI